LKKGKAVKEKNLQPPLFFFAKKLVSYLTPSRFIIDTQEKYLYAHPQTKGILVIISYHLTKKWS
jgi:hypothetical protein